LLADTYARDKPLALSARLVFEQSYEEVEGDSASLAELLALLSRLAEVPLRQGVAVTGSVNQRGEVQPVGGVNEKIEGFFDACTIDGLSGDQGVILPAANVENLMLRDDVVEAIAAGRFHVYAVRHVDVELEILTRLAAGSPQSDRTGPAEEIHARVNQCLQALAGALREFTPAINTHQNGAVTTRPRGSDKRSTPRRSRRVARRPPAQPGWGY
jgi:predicted ATP-dependent protease